MYSACAPMSLLTEWACHALVALTLTVFTLMLPCIFKRRAAVIKAPVHTWAAWTFPTCSTANVICLWHQVLQPESVAIGRAAVVCGCITLAVVATTNAAFWVSILRTALLRQRLHVEDGRDSAVQLQGSYSLGETRSFLEHVRALVASRDLDETAS